MRFSYLIPMLALSGCVNLEFPGLIADTAKVSKEAYASVVGKKEAKTEPANSAVVQGEYIAHSYIGSENQSASEIKQLCVNEAAKKIAGLAGKDARYSVAENTIATVNNTVVANCRLTIERAQADQVVVRQ